MLKAFCSNAGLPGSFTKALSYEEQIQFLIDKYNKMADVINNLKIDVDISDVVKYIPQTGFSQLQKQQARNNIGAGTSNITSSDVSTQIDNNSVKFSGAQNLTKDQKAQARNNIGAGTSNITSGDISTQIDNNSVKFSGVQNLTEDQKAQARNNIGAGTSNITSGDISTQIDNNSVKFSGVQNLTEDQKAQARANIGAGTGSGSGSAENAVLYIAQELTEGQKTQARNNIGAGTSNITSGDISTQINNNSVKFSGAQSLTEEQKLQARNNIGIETGTINSAEIVTNNNISNITIKYIKIKNVVTVTGYLNITTAFNDNVEVIFAKLPSPIHITEVALGCYDIIKDLPTTNMTTVQAALKLNSNGNLSIIKKNFTTGYLRFCFSYITQT